MQESLDFGRISHILLSNRIILYGFNPIISVIFKVRKIIFSLFRYKIQTLEPGAPLRVNRGQIEEPRGQI